ncbi:MAG: type II toxin-antitoxin system VapC family toxin, partial [Thermoproteota archaeon]
MDANYWIYWFDRRLPEHRYVQETMRTALHQGVVLNVVTLMEIAHYLRSLPPEDFQRKIDLLKNTSTLTFIPLDLELTEIAFQFLKKYGKTGLGGRDSVILATMKTTDTEKIA